MPHHIHEDLAPELVLVVCGEPIAAKNIVDALAEDAGPRVQCVPNVRDAVLSTDLSGHVR